jgi:hypothetical protein
MDSRSRMASEAAATASKARVVVCGKPTTHPSPNGSSGARASLRAAIDAKCRSCVYDPGSGRGGWREQVRACSSANCPLHSVRPLPVKARKIGCHAHNAFAAPVGSNESTASFPVAIVGCNNVISDDRRAA